MWNIFRFIKYFLQLIKKIQTSSGIVFSHFFNSLTFFLGIDGLQYSIKLSSNEIELHGYTFITKQIMNMRKNFISFTEFDVKIKLIYKMIIFSNLYKIFTKLLH